MKCACVLLFVLFGCMWRYGEATCVLESDFGFVINCAFKKSGLFRVRNLGGVKAHVGLGFSLGDELGFKESLSNVEGNRRRSAAASPLIAHAALAQQNQRANNNNISRSSASNQQLSYSNLKQTPTVPPFKPIPPAPERPIVSMITGVNTTRLRPTKDAVLPEAMGIITPSFNKMPSQISRVSHGAASPSDLGSHVGIMVPVRKEASDKMSNNFAIRTLPTDQNSDFPPALPQTNSNSIQSLLAVSNMTEDDLEAAILQRQKRPTTTTTTTTTTPKPRSNHVYKHATVGKVMNAPREYYPVGYDKNFDDNFSSRVDLPETSFHCGDQKHFPGLYADEDLGCMVFHVCALTDDGLIMKSFLCPESTLFDQTILKCNWWFYVDCKNSKRLYDSNIPISKSYQLMKALTFFSSYKKESSKKETPSNNNSTSKPVD